MLQIGANSLISGEFGSTQIALEEIGALHHRGLRCHIMDRLLSNFTTDCAVSAFPSNIAVSAFRPVATMRRIQATHQPANMNRLAKFLPLENVVLGLAVTSKKRVFEQAGLIFENQNGIARSTVTDNLFARERLGSTGLGEGVAIPHGRIKGLKQPLAAFVRLAEPIAFESPDGQPVSLLIFLLVPEQATQQHLEILSEIAQLLSDTQARERLNKEEDREALYKVLTQWQP